MIPNFTSFTLLGNSGFKGTWVAPNWVQGACDAPAVGAAYQHDNPNTSVSKIAESGFVHVGSTKT
jgi:hypothetical protein